MKFSFDHNNINVLDLEKSVEFYKDALGFVETRKFNAPDDSFTLVFLGDETTGHKLELTCMKDRTEPYNLGENEFHLAVVTDDFDEAYAHHKEMRCICFENKPMGIYFIMDPDGYWIEIIPTRK
jgi:lactoylglutathione lyase